MSEQELIAGIKKRDQQAFKLLVDQFQSMVLNTCFLFVHDEDDAKDLTQDVFVEIYNSIHSFRGDAKVSTWLYRIAINKSLNFIKKHKRKKLINNLEEYFQIQKYSLSNDSFNADKNLDDEERSEYLYNAINSLSKNQRIAFNLHKLDRISYAEIAEIMNISISSVESLMYRAKRNLQKRLISFYKKNME
jgi:RNA polymerase sigma-70 factor (ECF subfamily)